MKLALLSEVGLCPSQTTSGDRPLTQAALCNESGPESYSDVCLLLQALTFDPQFPYS